MTKSAHNPATSESAPQSTKARPLDWTRTPETLGLVQAQRIYLELGHSLERLAELTDCAESTLSRILAGKSKPGRATRKALERVMGIPSAAWDRRALTESTRSSEVADPLVFGLATAAQTLRQWSAVVDADRYTNDRRFNTLAGCVEVRELLGSLLDVVLAQLATEPMPDCVDLLRRAANDPGALDCLSDSMPGHEVALVQHDRKLAQRVLAALDGTVFDDSERYSETRERLRKFVVKRLAAALEGNG